VGGIPTFIVIKAGGKYSARYAVKVGFVGGVSSFLSIFTVECKSSSAGQNKFFPLFFLGLDTRCKKLVSQ
jgi:hypothetical protein